MDKKKAIISALTQSAARSSATPQPLPSGGNGALLPYAPSLRERLGNLIYDGARAAGLPNANRMRNEASMAVDFIPGVGDAVGLNEAARDFGNGNYGIAAAGLGATAAGVIPGVGDAAGKAMKKLAIGQLAGQPDVFVRWSRGPEFDMKPGARSKDYVSGDVHDGLSAVSLKDAEDVEDLLRSTNDYSFLRMKDPKIRAHFYRADQVGVDSDTAPTIRPKEYIGSISDELMGEIEDNNLIRRLALEREISRNKIALEAYKREKPWGIPIYSQETLAKAMSELESLGGHVDKGKFGLE